MQLSTSLKRRPGGLTRRFTGASIWAGALTRIRFRTMVVCGLTQPAAWGVQVQGGAGSVAISQRQRIRKKTLNKARGLLQALAAWRDGNAHEWAFV